MAQAAQKRRAALRRLFEHYGCPVADLAIAAGYRPETLERIARKEKWRNDGACRDLLDGLRAACQGEIERLQQSDGDDGPSERRARALGLHAKAVETLVSAQLKLNAPQGGEPSRRTPAPDEKTPVDASRTLDFHEQISKLVGGRISQGHAG